jgi:hypothetical protein
MVCCARQSMDVTCKLNTEKEEKFRNKIYKKGRFLIALFCFRKYQIFLLSVAVNLFDHPNYDKSCINAVNEDVDRLSLVDGFQDVFKISNVLNPGTVNFSYDVS